MKLLTADYRAERDGGHYRIDVGGRLRVEEYHGKVGLEEMRALLGAMVSDPCWSADYNGLIDFSGAEPELTANEVLRLALILRHEQNRSSGWLVYVVPNSTVHGLVRMLCYWSRNSERLRIFANREEAEAWALMNKDLAPPHFREVPPESGESALREVV